MIGIVKAFFKPSPVDPNSADASSVPVLPASDEHGVGKSILPICAAEQAFVEWMGKQGTLLDVLRNILPLTAAVATNGDLRRLVTASISVSKTQYSSAGLVEILRELEIPARPPASIGVTGAVRYSTRSRSNPPTIVPPGGSSGIGGGAAGNAQPRT